MLITIVSHGCYGFARPCIESILKNTDEPFDLLIVNNTSGADSSTQWYNELIKQHSNVFLIQNHINMGIAVSWNQAIDFMFKNSDYKWMSFFHTDTVFNKGWASKIKKAFNDHPEYIGFSPIEINTTEVENITIKYLTKNRELMNAYDHNMTEQPDYVKKRLGEVYFGDFESVADSIENQCKGKVINGAGYSAVTFKKEVFEKVGYFDEYFYPGSSEDLDFSVRMEKLGLKTAKTGNAFSHHWCSVTFIHSNKFDGRLIANQTREKYTKKITDNIEKTCLKESCKWNKGGICEKGFIHLLPTSPCSIYEYADGYAHRERGVTTKSSQGYL